MHAIQVENNEVFEGIMHGFMHKGLNEERHNHSAPDVLYISTSDRAASFEVRGILRKSEIPSNFIACGYASVLHRLRGRSIDRLTLMLSPEVLQIAPDLFCGALANVIDRAPGVSRDHWLKEATLVTFGPNSRHMLTDVQERLYKNYLERNPMFTQGSENLTSNLTVPEFYEHLEETSRLESPATVKLRGQFFFGPEYRDLDQAEFYNNLLKFSSRVNPGNNMVFHPATLRNLYNHVLCALHLTNVNL